MSENNNSTRYESALREADNLSEFSEDSLFEQLGLRIQDMQNIGGYERAKQYSGEFSHAADDLLSMDDIREFGRRWWKKLEPVLMKMVCDSDNEDMKKITSGQTIPQVAAALATSAVISVLAPPAWIIVVTSILAAKIVDTGLETLCEMWHESISGS